MRPRMHPLRIMRDTFAPESHPLQMQGTTGGDEHEFVESRFIQE